MAENGLDQEKGRAQIMEFDIASGQSRPFATGLRNSNGMACSLKVANFGQL